MRAREKEHRVILKNELASVERAEKAFKENAERFELMNRRLHALMDLVADDSHREAAVVRKRESLLSERKREVLLSQWETSHQREAEHARAESRSSARSASPGTEAPTLLIALAEARRAQIQRVNHNIQQSEAERAAYSQDVLRQRQESFEAAAKRRDEWQRSAILRARTQSKKLEEVHMTQQQLDAEKRLRAEQTEQRLFQKIDSATMARQQNIKRIVSRLTERHKHEVEVDLIDETAPSLPPVYKAQLLAEEAKKRDEKAKSTSMIASRSRRRSSSPPNRMPQTSPRAQQFSDEVLDAEIRNMGLEPLGPVPVYSTRARQQDAHSGKPQPQRARSKSQGRRKPFSILSLTLDPSALKKSNASTHMLSSTQPFTASKSSIDPWSRLYLTPLLRAATVPPAPPGHELVLTRRPKRHDASVPRSRSRSHSRRSSHDQSQAQELGRTDQSVPQPTGGSAVQGESAGSSTTAPASSSAIVEQPQRDRSLSPSAHQNLGGAIGSDSTGWLAEAEMYGKPRHIQRKILLSSRLALYRHNVAANRMARAEEAVATKSKVRTEVLAARTQQHLRKAREAAERYKQLDQETRTETQLNAEERARRAQMVLEALRKAREKHLNERRRRNHESQIAALEHVRRVEQEKQELLEKREQAREAAIAKAQLLMKKENELTRQRRRHDNELRNVRQRALRLQAESELLEVRTEQLERRIALLEKAAEHAATFNEHVK